MIDLKLSENSTIGFLVDVSGGVADTLLNNFRPIIKSNLSSLNAFKAKIVTFNHDVVDIKKIVPGNIDNVDAVSENYGGGTDVDPALEKVTGSDEYVVFTDGFLLTYDKLLEVKDKVTIVLYPSSHTFVSAEYFEEHFVFINSMGFKKVIKG